MQHIILYFHVYVVYRSNIRKDIMISSNNYFVHLLFEKMYFINIIRSINETKVKFKISNFELKCYFVHIHCIKYKYL